jgi:hypothetical protein
MQESCTYGSMRGAPGNGRSYRNRQIGTGSAPVRPMVRARPVRPKEPTRDKEMLAQIEDFIAGFNQPTYRGMRVNGERVPVWSSQHGWSGL